MVLEATMVCVDNSEFQRNSDFTPTRLEAQRDSVNMIVGAKTQANPESCVGILTMAGGVKCQVTPTTDIGKLLSSFHDVKIQGKTDLYTGLAVAQLALKHRQNKNQRQRIVAFVGSPIETPTETLVKLGKKLKKNNVALDVVSFGEGENTEKLEALIAAVDSNSNSHLVTVPPGPHILSDILLSSPVVRGDDDGVGAAGGADGGGFDYGVDPSVDPELALALRVSMEEERARQAAAAGGDGAAGEDGAAAAAAAAGAPAAAAADGDVAMEDTDPALAEALALSMKEQQPAKADEDKDVAMADAAGAGGDDDEDEELRLAMQLSLEQAAAAGTSGDEPKTLDSLASDPAFLSQAVAGLPGVDPNDPKIKEAISKAAKPETDDMDEDDDMDDDLALALQMSREDNNKKK